MSGQSNINWEKPMRKRLLRAGVIFIVIAAIMAVFYNFTLSPQGTTTESREEILNTTISTGTNWTIATETEIEGHIISAAYSTDNKVSQIGRASCRERV